MKPFKCIKLCQNIHSMLTIFLNLILCRLKWNRITAIQPFIHIPSNTISYELYSIQTNQPTNKRIMESFHRINSLFLPTFISLLYVYVYCETYFCNIFFCSKNKYVKTLPFIKIICNLN